MSTTGRTGRYSNPTGLLIARAFLLLLLVVVLVWPGPLWVVISYLALCVVLDAGMRRKGLAVSPAGLELRFMFWSARLPWAAIAGFETASGSSDAPRTGDHVYVLSSVCPKEVVRWPGVVERVRGMTTSTPTTGYRIELPGVVQGGSTRTPSGELTRDLLSHLEADRHTFAS